jgi:hypothetical protein
MLVGKVASRLIANPNPCWLGSVRRILLVPAVPAGPVTGYGAWSVNNFIVRHMVARELA